VSLSVFAAAADAPDHPAVITEREMLTFAGLADRARDAVARLRDRSLEGAEPVALIAGHDLATLVTVHALIATGTPALLLHPRLTPAERVGLMDAVRPIGVVDPGRLGDHDPEPGTGPGTGPAGPESAATAAHRSAGEGELASDPDPDAPPDDERTLAIVQTSGTTGRPRGVILSRRAFVASARASAANLGWRDDDRWLLPLPMAHVGGLSVVTRCLLARRTVVLSSDADARSLLDSVQRHRVTLVSLVPTVLKRFLDLDPPGPPEHLRAILLGGAAASPALLGRAADRGWPVLTTYGLTEACSQVTTQRYGTRNRGEAGAGPPLPGIELRIGGEDEILVRGPTLFTRYAPPGIDRPIVDGGWFPTGDRGRLDGRGNLHVLGRRSDRIITGGENVDPAEVEHVLETLPAIREACVFGVPDEEWGERVCAAVVPERAEDEEALGGRIEGQIRGLRDRLAAFKLPRGLAVVDSLPRNATGKVDRREAARLARERLRPM
jgi:O-succinylbenzoic acid--CoA ligase